MDTNPLPTFLLQCELADRWRLSERTLEGWRTRSLGPKFLKLNNGRILYRLTDVEDYERESLGLCSDRALIAASKGYGL